MQVSENIQNDLPLSLRYEGKIPKGDKAGLWSGLEGPFLLYPVNDDFYSFLLSVDAKNPHHGD